jgi:uncharacterized protein YneR
MKHNLRPKLFIVMLVLVGLACSAAGGAPAEEPTAAPVNTQPAPTDTVVVPTDTPANTATPANTPTPRVREFFTEEFENNNYEDQWFSFVFGPGSDNEDEIEIFQEGDGLTFDLNARDMYLYYIYDPKEYTDVKLTMVAENLGRNNNNISLICRLNEATAEWYEFSVESGGVWFLYAVTDGYDAVDSGGTRALKQGKETNEYGLKCEGNVITMYINGEELKTYTDNKYSLSDGKVGFNISSLNVLPITVNVKSFDIAQP